MKWVIKVILYGLALLVADKLISGFEIKGLEAALIAALVLGIINALIKPILVILTLPVTVLSLGLFILVINALLFSLTAYLVDGFEVYTIAGAFWGALITGIISWIFNLFVKDK